MGFEPSCRGAQRLIQGSRFLKQVAGAGHDVQCRSAGHSCLRIPIQGENIAVIAANDEQRGSGDARQGPLSQIWPSATGHDGCHILASGRRDNGRATSCAGAEQTDRQIFYPSIRARPRDRIYNPMRQ
jgi:hypothetical protein